MVKIFTLSTFLCFFILGFQGIAQKPKGNAASSVPTNQGNSNPNSTSTSSGKEVLELTLEEAIQYGFVSSEEEALKNLKKSPQGKFLVSANFEKASEIRKKQVAENGDKSPIDLVIIKLPKIKMVGNMEETALEYRKLLEENFHAFPDLLNSLGTEFQRYFEDQTLFLAMVKTAIDKGHTIQ